MRRGNAAGWSWWWCLALGATAVLLITAYNRWFTVAVRDGDLPILGLPLPVLDRLTVNRGNSYKLLQSSSARRHVIVVIRTYVGFQEATRALLANLDEQLASADGGGIAVHAIIVPTDLNSTTPLRQLVSTGAWRQALFPRLQVHFHHADASVYADNCCQVTEMCTAPHLQSAWLAHMARRYGHYKSASQRAKLQQACSGNNLLHYVLTDAALMYARDSILSSPSSPSSPSLPSSPSPAADSVFLVFTNGDNSYSRSFVASMVAAMEARPELDLVMCDYLERGQGLVRSTLRVNQMDLGATMYRLSSLRRMGSTFLDAMPRNAWPSHYYAADAEYVRFLVNSQGARWGKVDEVLFTHW